MRLIYVVARNATGRATLQHKVDGRSSAQTVCGRSILGWSRAYQAEPIKAILCKSCERSSR